MADPVEQQMGVQQLKRSQMGFGAHGAEPAILISDLI
jgi:hypothetical protein